MRSLRGKLFEENLINEVQKYPFLYERQKGTCQAEKVVTWTKISKRLKRKEIFCRRRWKTLRDRFVKEYVMKQNSNEDSKWSFYSQLLFLEDHIAPKSIDTRYPVKSNTDDISEKPHIPFYHIDILENSDNHSLYSTEETLPTDPTCNRSFPSNTSETTTERTESSSQTSEELEGHLLQFLSKVAAVINHQYDKQQQENSNKEFLNLLSDKLNELPELVKEETKLDVLNLVFKRVIEYRRQD